MTSEDEKVLEHHRQMAGGCNHMDKRALLRIIEELRGELTKHVVAGRGIIDVVTTMSDQRAALAEALKQRLGQCCPSAGNPNRLTWCKTCVSDDALLVGLGQLGAG